MARVAVSGLYEKFVFLLLCLTSKGIIDWNETIHMATEQLKKVKLDTNPGNKLKDLPDGFAKLSNLKFLDLSWNKFENFPTAILSLSKRGRLGDQLILIFLILKQFAKYLDRIETLLLCQLLWQYYTLIVRF